MNRDRRKNQKKKKKPKKVLLRLVIAAVTFAVVFLLLAVTAVPQQHVMEVGQIARSTVKAPRDIVDEYSTGIKIEEARDNVSAKYTQDDSVTDTVSQNIEDFYSLLDSVRSLGEIEKKRKQDLAGESASFVPYDNDFLTSMQEEMDSRFTKGEILALLELGEEEYLAVLERARILITDAMEAGVKESAVEDTVSSLNQQLISPINNFSENAQKVGMSIITLMLKPNFFYDAESTEAARDAAEASVEVVMYMQGENIVREGERIDTAQYEMLKSMGMIADSESNYKRYVALLSLELLLFLVFAFYLGSAHKNVLSSPKMLLTISALMILSLLVSWGGSQVHKFIAPVYFSTFICVMMVEKKSLALVLNAMLSILASVMFLRFGDEVALQILISSLVAGTVTVILFKKLTQRATLMIAGLLSGLSVGVVFVVFALINYEGWMDMLLYAGMGLASGLVASVLAIGTLPMWESVFRMLTPMKLLEIANPNQPLLKKLLNEAPGTYHHSIMVGNLAERAAEAVGANSLLVRAGAYYHDIGKLKRPYFFVENQQGRTNPHDNIKPDLSTRIILSHLTDGIELAKKAKLPSAVLDIVKQHHGTTAVMYFYHKTKQAAMKPEEVRLDDFRYDGERPVSKESAILMLADSVEAAVRSLDSPSALSVREMIDKIIKARLDDGQLNNSDLTMSEIQKIADSFMTALVGLYHERVEYPGEENER
jgi:hypothetical protein